MLGLVLLIPFGYFSFVISRKTGKIESFEKVKKGDLAIAGVNFVVSMILVIFTRKISGR